MPTVWNASKALGLSSTMYVQKSRSSLVSLFAACIAIVTPIRQPGNRQCRVSSGLRCVNNADAHGCQSDIAFIRSHAPSVALPVRNSVCSSVVLCPIRRVFVLVDKFLHGLDYILALSVAAILDAMLVNAGVERERQHNEPISHRQSVVDFSGNRLQ